MEGFTFVERLAKGIRGFKNKPQVGLSPIALAKGDARDRCWSYSLCRKPNRELRRELGGGKATKLRTKLTRKGTSAGPTPFVVSLIVNFVGIFSCRLA